MCRRCIVYGKVVFADGWAPFDSAFGMGMVSEAMRGGVKQSRVARVLRLLPWLAIPSVSCIWRVTRLETVLCVAV